MIEKSKHDGHWDAYCDKCGKTSIHTQLIPAENFSEVIQELKKLGWMIEKNEARGWWEHICPKCQKEGAPPKTTVNHEGW